MWHSSQKETFLTFILNIRMIYEFSFMDAVFGCLPTVWANYNLQKTVVWNKTAKKRNSVPLEVCQSPIDPIVVARILDIGCKRTDTSVTKIRGIRVQRYWPCLLNISRKKYFPFFLSYCLFYCVCYYLFEPQTICVCTAAPTLIYV